jgi:hypothetical protein
LSALHLLGAGAVVVVEALVVVAIVVGGVVVVVEVVVGVVVVVVVVVVVGAVVVVVVVGVVLVVVVVVVVVVAVVVGGTLATQFPGGSRVFAVAATLVVPGQTEDWSATAFGFAANPRVGPQMSQTTNWDLRKTSPKMDIGAPKLASWRPPRHKMGPPTRF